MLLNVYGTRCLIVEEDLEKKKKKNSFENDEPGSQKAEFLKEKKKRFKLIKKEFCLISAFPIFFRFLFPN